MEKRPPHPFDHSGTRGNKKGEPEMAPPMSFSRKRLQIPAERAKGAGRKRPPGEMPIGYRD